MVNATVFPEPYGWQNIINESQFNPINASVIAWKSSAGGVAWLFASAFIILLVPAAIYIKSQNLTAAAFGQILMTLFMQHYGLVHESLVWPMYISAIVMIAFPVAFKLLAKR